MKTLSAPTGEQIKGERTQLTADAAAGSNVTLSVTNGDGIVAHSYVVIGFEGGDTAELCLVSAVTATSITVGTLKLSHKNGEPIVVYRYNQRKFYGATTLAGSYTELTSYGSPAAIQPDDPQGATLEYTGSEGYAYFKASYYNAYLSQESDDFDQLEADDSTRYASLYAIRKAAGMKDNPRYSDARIETKRSQSENEINSAISVAYVLPLAEIPAFISNICELMAAGYIQYEEFGADGNGGKMLGEARALIKGIVNNTYHLIGTDGQELARFATIGAVNGYPDSTDTDAAQFSMNDRY